MVSGLNKLAGLLGRSSRLVVKKIYANLPCKSRRPHNAVSLFPCYIRHRGLRKCSEDTQLFSKCQKDISAFGFYGLLGMLSCYSAVDFIMVFITITVFINGCHAVTNQSLSS